MPNVSEENERVKITFSHFAKWQGSNFELRKKGFQDTIIAVDDYAIILLMEEIPNNHLGCIEPRK